MESILWLQSRPRQPFQWELQSRKTFFFKPIRETDNCKPDQLKVMQLAQKLFMQNDESEAVDCSVRGKSLEEVDCTGQSQQDFRLQSINHLVNTITVDIKYNNKLESFYSWFNASHVLDTVWNSNANVKMVTSAWGSQIPWQILKFTIA